MTEEFEYFFELEDLAPFVPRRLPPVRRSEPAAPEDVIESSAAGNTNTDPAERSHPAPPSMVESKTELPVADSGGEDTTPRLGTPTEPDVAPVPAPMLNSATTSLNGRTRVRNLLSVHALGQFAFCPRAAILAIETGDESDIDEPPPRLDYLPTYDLERIEAAISEQLRHLALTALLAVGLGLMMTKGLMESNRLWFYPPLVLQIPVLAWCLELIYRLAVLAVRRQAALRASDRIPAPDIQHVTPVNWWSLRKAGFEARDYPRPFRHPELPLEGSPWRVLEQGSLRIPVIRSGAKSLTGRDGQLYRKHEVRLAAYGLLLETMAHTEAPYGVVLPAGSTQGLAVPLTSRLRAEAVQLLDEFAQRLHDSQAGRAEPNPPRQQSRCHGCLHGFPEPISQSEIDRARKSGVPLLVLERADGQAFHCRCGDRFGTAPPHKKSLRLNLRPVLAPSSQNS
ncbi:MAG: hypothetical protein DWQ34_24520 [Planctomycetota bacterium]|nr:MAG: hypothetical protein DWQ34_24520 [Planctomycetota bacterium]